MRLDKYISQTTDYSRKEVKQLLKKALIDVDGITTKNPAQAIADEQKVRLKGQLIKPPAPRYFMLNKPLGYVSATKDSEHPVALDLLDEANKDQLQIAGRLDIDTTGLLLITDDGRWNHAVTSPRAACKKRYYLCTAEAIAPDAVSKFAAGIMLKGESKKTQPALLELLYSNEAHLTISEGKYHQVKRMIAALGNAVESLHREAIGGITLDADLAEGEYRELTEDEVNSIASASHA